MPVTRRQLQLAKANNEDERVAKFEEFYHFDVEKAEKVRPAISRISTNRDYFS